MKTYSTFKIYSTFEGFSNFAKNIVYCKKSSKFNFVIKNRNRWKAVSDVIAGKILILTKLIKLSCHGISEALILKNDRLFNTGDMKYIKCPSCKKIFCKKCFKWNEKGVVKWRIHESVTCMECNECVVWWMGTFSFSYLILSDQFQLHELTDTWKLWLIHIKDQFSIFFAFERSAKFVFWSDRKLVTPKKSGRYLNQKFNKTTNSKCYISFSLLVLFFDPIILSKHLVKGVWYPESKFSNILEPTIVKSIALVTRWFTDSFTKITSWFLISSRWPNDYESKNYLAEWPL